MFYKSFFQTRKNAASTAGELKSAPKYQLIKNRPWRPVTLRAPYLVSLILATAALIFVIQWLLTTSRREQGIIFAENIDGLPLRQSFCYLYLPTIISVVYSFLWTWVDLDVKRLEPFFQLSRPGGATGAESLLLSYPLELLVTVPLNAFKRRHWSVLMASLITILVSGGLTPTQAGIFATRTVTVSASAKGSYSTEYTPIGRQGNLTADYAQSVYNIAWLNESLPPFMTREYALSAFGPADDLFPKTIAENYTGITNLYSIDIACEPARPRNASRSGPYISSGGCDLISPVYRPMGGTDPSKTYDTIYVGYQNPNGNALYDLSNSCNESFSHLFFVRWSNLSTSAITTYDGAGPSDLDSKQANETSLFCQPSYYQQKVNATISLPSNAVLKVEQIGEKMPLAPDFFNVSTFELVLSSGGEAFPPRGDFPTADFPDQRQELADLPLNLAYLPRTAPFAIATYKRPMQEYLDSEVLRAAYQSAYRLLFARRVVDILGGSLDAKTQNEGWREVAIQAVVVVPVFAYAATGLLVVILLIATAFAINISRRPNELERDPATLSALMDIVAGDPATVQRFAPLSHRGEEGIREPLQNGEFSLVRTKGLDGRSILRNDAPEHSQRSRRGSSEEWPSIRGEGPHDDDVETNKGVRPGEMKLTVGATFLVLQVVALVSFVLIYCIAAEKQGNAQAPGTQTRYAKTDYVGLPLPSHSDFPRQLVENYIPIVFATLSEPFWLVLNRLLCLLQPFEELRKGEGPAARTVDLDYSSLPPQILFMRALKARHNTLALVCSMVLLANILAVALSSLMFEGSKQIATATELRFLKALPFRELNGTALPFNTDQAPDWNGGTTSGPFYYEMSNLTAGTPLPPWMDEGFAYLPVDLTAQNKSEEFRITTTAAGAELDCQALAPQNFSMNFTGSAVESYFEAYLSDDEGAIVDCTNFMKTTGDDLRGMRDPQPGHVALEINFMLTNNKSVEHDMFCRQHAVFGWLRMDWNVVSGQVNHGAGGVDDYNARLMNITSRNETLLLCKPVLSIGPAEVIVDSDGRVLQRLSANTSPKAIAQHFESSPQDLVAQANQFLTDIKPTWHTDSYPSDWINYLIKQSTNDTSLLDPSQSIPTPAHATQRIKPLYAKLFAILLTTNQNLLFSDPSADNPRTSGVILRPETRILFSTPAFAVTVAILVLYLLTTVFYYARRPWRVLPRLPSTLGSNIAFFAASRALADITANDMAKDKQIGRNSWKWGYGKFKGTDGRMHIGIEREPFVTRLKKRR